MAPDDITKGLIALVGSGGIIGLINAVTGFNAAARDGRKPEDGSVTIAVSKGLSADKWQEESNGHLATIAYALTKLAALMEIKVEQEVKDGALHDRIENKIGRIMIDAIRASVAQDRG